MNAKVRTCLWFEGNGHEAADFYVSLLPDSAIERVFHPAPGAPPLVIDFRLGGTPYQILNAGPGFKHTEAASISVLTADQAETDRLWAMLCQGGSEGKCGWLKDRYGVSWQIVPAALPQLMSTADAAAGGRLMQAIMTMNKLDLATLEAAAKG